MKPQKNYQNDYLVVEKFILRSDTIVEGQTIPLYDIDAVAGITSLFVEEQPAVEQISLPALPRCDGAIHVIGDSMLPVLRQGDIVLYKIVQSRRGGLFFGEMYLIAFVLEGEEYICIKYVHPSHIPGHYRLESCNPNHPPRDIPIDSVRAMALIKASIRYHAVG